MRSGLICILLLAGFFSHAQPSYSLTFDGIDDYGLSGNTIPANSSYTKEAWLYVQQNSGNKNIISSLNAPFWISGGSLKAGHGGDYTIVTDNILFPLNQWVHVATTYNAATSVMSLYRNGQLINSAVTASAITSEPTFIGAHQASTSLFAGRMDDLRVWTVALSAEQIRRNMFEVPPAERSGLITWYRFNEGTGSTLQNAGSGAPGILFNSPAWTNSEINPGRNAINFDGIDDHIVLPNTVSSSFTVEFMMRTTSTGAGGTMWFQGQGIVDAEMPGATNDWGLSLLGNRVAFGIGGGGLDRTILSTTAVNLGDWIHIAATWSQITGLMQLYVNGVLQSGTTSSNLNLRNAPSRITLGQIQTNINRFNGSIDELRIWNIVRTGEQISANKFSEINAATESGLVAYYNFDQGIAEGSNLGLTVLYELKNGNNGSFQNMALSGTTSNFVPQYSALSILPVNWMSFDAILQEGNAALKWITSTETNTNLFHIQHRTSSTNWSDIATIKAAGNSSKALTYTHLHRSIPLGLNYYRILQTDLDGKSGYSAVQSIVNRVNTETEYTIYSNPVTNGILQLNLSQASQLSVYSSTGQLLFNRRADAGNNSINLQSYGKGIYLLKINERTSQIVVK